MSHFLNNELNIDQLNYACAVQDIVY